MSCIYIYIHVKNVQNVKRMLYWLYMLYMFYMLNMWYILYMLYYMLWIHWSAYGRSVGFNKNSDTFLVRPEMVASWNSKPFVPNETQKMYPTSPSTNAMIPPIFNTKNPMKNIEPFTIHPPDAQHRTSSGWGGFGLGQLFHSDHVAQWSGGPRQQLLGTRLHDSDQRSGMPDDEWIPC